MHVEEKSHAILLAFGYRLTSLPSVRNKRDVRVYVRLTSSSGEKLADQTQTLELEVISSKKHRNLLFMEIELFP